MPLKHTNFHSFIILVITFSLLISTHTQNITCHYTCASCISSAYYHCISCLPNRGSSINPLVPFAGMCYCSSSGDESPTGQCLTDSTWSISNRSLIWAFIILTLIISSFILIIRGLRYYLIKIIEDIQQISLLIYINMYFPQHFDLLMTQMYRFNISSFLFESIAAGGLFKVGPDGSVLSLDGMNVPGKYNLLFKTANFFSNMFTWTIVLLILIGFMLLIRFLRNRFANQNQKTKVQKIGQESMNASQAEIANIKNNQSFVISENQSQANQRSPQKMNIVRQKYQITKINRKNPYDYTFANLLKKLHHILNFNFLIIFFYLSLIELNINIFTQMKNLSFVSGFAGFGSIFCIVFFGIQIAALIWLFYKCKTELLKRQWMLDHSYTALLYLIRINEKSLSKYFFFLSSAKKIFFAMIIVVFYDLPEKAIQGFSILQLIFVLVSLYIEPFEKRHLRIHFYLCEVMKLFLFLSLINFVEKYKEYTTLTQVAEIFFVALGIIFGFHFFALLFCLLFERKIYWYSMKKIYYKMKRAYSKSAKSEEEIKNSELIIGYFNYLWQKEEVQEQPVNEQQNKKMQEMSKDLKQLQLNESAKISQKRKNQEEEELPELKQRKYFLIYKNYEK